MSSRLRSFLKGGTNKEATDLIEQPSASLTAVDENQSEAGAEAEEETGGGLEEDGGGLDMGL